MKNKQILLIALLFSTLSSQAAWFWGASWFWGKDSVITKAVSYFTAPKLEKGVEGFADDLSGYSEVEPLMIPLEFKKPQTAVRRTTLAEYYRLQNQQMVKQKQQFESRLATMIFLTAESIKKSEKGFEQLEAQNAVLANRIKVLKAQRDQEKSLADLYQSLLGQKQQSSYLDSTGPSSSLDSIEPTVIADLRRTQAGLERKYGPIAGSPGSELVFKQSKMTLEELLKEHNDSLIREEYRFNSFDSKQASRDFGNISTIGYTSDEESLFFKDFKAGFNRS